jgi:predicted MFS family arabinose efflux permease
MMIYLVVSNFLLYFGFQVWQTLFNNFAVESVKIGPAEVGLVQAVREIPGLLGFLVGFLALYLSEVRIMAFSIILMGLGIVATGYSTTLPILLATTFVMSFGFHFFTPSTNAVVLMVAKLSEAPRALGKLGSLGSLAAVTATAAIYLLARPWGYQTMFAVVGGLVVIGGIALLPLGGNGGELPAKRQIVLRKRYWLYYALSFLLGSRRHIFSTFAIYLLVREYHINVQTTAVLFLVNSLVNIVTLRWVGQLISRFGERITLSIAFAALILVFLGYAYITSLPVLYVLFVLDNIFIGFNLGLTTYFQKIAVSPEEITSNLSVEQTINHIAAIVIPVVGGTVWVVYGSQAPFIFGAFIVLAALALTQFMPTTSETAIVDVRMIFSTRGIGRLRSLLRKIG